MQRKTLKEAEMKGHKTREKAVPSREMLHHEDDHTCA